MGLNNPITEDEYEQTLGMDLTSNEASIPKGYVREAWNANIGLSGGYQSRGGHANALSSPWTGLSVTGGIEFRTPSVTARTVLYGTDGTNSGGKIGYVSAGAVTNIKTSLSGTARPSFVQLGQLLAMFNGVDDPVIYDGTTTRQMGVTAPAAAPSGFSQTTSGSLTLLGSYLWAYTYYNSVTGAESSPSLVAGLTLTGSNNKASFSVLAGDATTADTIRIWRTVANGNQLFLEDAIAISSTSYNSTKADSSLASTALEQDNTRITLLAPALNTIAAQYPSVAQNRVFVKTDRNVIRNSKVGQSGPMFESFEVSALASTRGKYGDRDDIVGTGVAGDVPIILKERSIGRLDAVGVQGASLGFDQVRYNYVEITDSVSAVSHWAGCQVFGEYVFLGRDNVYATDGQEVRPIADTLSAFIRTCGFASTQVSKISCENDVRYRRIIISVFSSGLATVPDYQLVGDYQKYPNFRWTFYRPGTNTGTHPGIRPGCFFLVQNTVDGGYDLYAGNIELNGQYYELNSGTSDRGNSLYYHVKTRAYPMGQPLADKLYKKTGLHARGNGGNYALTVSAVFDLSGDLENPQAISLASSGAEWDSAVWDFDAWSSDAILLREYNADRKAKFLQLVFENTGTDQPVELLGWATSAALYGIY